MPNIWTGKGNPYRREEVVQRLRETLRKGEPIIAAGAGTGISAKFRIVRIFISTFEFKMTGSAERVSVSSFPTHEIVTDSATATAAASPPPVAERVSVSSFPTPRNRHRFRY